MSDKPIDPFAPDPKWVEINARYGPDEDVIEEPTEQPPTIARRLDDIFGTAAFVFVMAQALFGTCTTFYLLHEAYDNYQARQEFARLQTDPVNDPVGTATWSSGYYVSPPTSTGSGTMTFGAGSSTGNMVMACTVNGCQLIPDPYARPSAPADPAATTPICAETSPGRYMCDKDGDGEIDTITINGKEFDAHRDCTHPINEQTVCGLRLITKT